MSLKEVLKKCVGKKVCLVHGEGERAHSLIGKLEFVNSDAIVLRTDFNVKNIVPLRCVLKIKEIGNEGVG